MFCFRKRWRKQLKPHALWTWAVYLGRRKAHWEDVGFISCPTIRKNIREKQTRAAWLINFKHHHEEFWISGPGQKNQEFVSVKSSKKMASGLRRVMFRELSPKKNLYGCFRKIGLPQNGWFILFILENPVKMDDLGGTTIFGNTYIADIVQKTKRISSSALAVQGVFLSQVR